ncbi:MAG TPA: tetratricopeptide repeat protein [Gemmataceae bacterium]|jgi:serine/threonine-protein kinase
MSDSKPSSDSCGDTRAFPAELPRTETFLQPGPAARPAAVALGRFVLGEPIGRGGMGVVYRAYDPALGREVAVKILLDRPGYAPDARAEVERRFLAEARAAARLQHPGVVPVHDLGRTDDGRPFIAMKLVAGRTLADLLAVRRHPGDDLPRFLHVFEQVCQTLAYAHAHGVVHRDLKPANVMVGAFGEVQVMDWGLALLLDGPPADPTDPEIKLADTVEDGPGLVTRGGWGTPAYMPPEQARGEADRIGARCDVFALGAVLCEILTGRPPYAGSDGQSVRDSAAGAELAPATARLGDCGADADLVRLALACLAADPAERPADAGAVAAVVAAYRAGVQNRLRAAELDQARAEATAGEARRRRKLRLALAASVLLTAGVVGGGWAWVETERARQRDVAERLESERLAAMSVALEQAADALRAGRWADARAALTRVEDRLRDADPHAVRAHAAHVRADLRTVAALEHARLVAADAMLGTSFDPTAAHRAYAAAFAAHGIPVLDLDPDAAAAKVRASPIAAALIDALDDWAARHVRDDGLRQRLAAGAGGADDDDWRKRVRAAWVAYDARALDELADEPAALDQPASALALLLAPTGGGESAGDLDLWRRARRRRPNDFWVNHDLAVALERGGPKHFEEAVGFYRTTVALRPDSPGAWYNLGNALAKLKRPAEAVDAYTTALRLSPDSAEVHNNLGNALADQGRFGDAEAEFRKAVALKPDEPFGHLSLGRLLHVLRRVEEAEREYRRAVQLRPDLALPRFCLASLLSDQKRMDESLAELRRAVELDPDHAPSRCNLGVQLLRRGELAAAETELRRAVAGKAEPSTLGAAYNALGALLNRQRKYAEAEAAYRMALIHRPDSHETRFNLGKVLQQTARLPDAEVEYRRALALKPNYAEARSNLGQILIQQGRFADAVAELRRGVEVSPNRSGPGRRLAHMLEQAERLGRLDEKLALVLRGEAQPADATEWFGLAGLCADHRKRYAAAAHFYAGAFAANPDPAADHRLAALAAARAAAGDGTDAPPDTAEQSRLRRLALDWLRADLADCGRRLNEDRSATLVRQRLRGLTTDPHLASVRDPDKLARLPGDERASWRQLWAAAAALADRAGPSP